VAAATGIAAFWGDEALYDAASSVDIALNAVVGFAGLPVTLGALDHGKRLALANKESLIAAAQVVNTSKQRGGGSILPVDSEHCAIHQCLSSDQRSLAKLVLTASGGPFRGKKLADLVDVDSSLALQHPTWSMGPKITVDSSTLMNKGLEVIEAQALFGVSVDDIDVVVHPESIVHSMVTFQDGATIAQLSLPDMRLPIAYALGFPEGLVGPWGALDWSEPRSLTFEPPDRETFLALDLAYEAGRIGGVAPAWLSASNEVAVDAFLGGRISWLQIGQLLAESLERLEFDQGSTLESVHQADFRARDVARAILAAKMEQ
jgi:1-deoxy-D-xylulose-5-phosphate reductoisomerase